MIILLLFLLSNSCSSCSFSHKNSLTLLESGIRMVPMILILPCLLLTSAMSIGFTLVPAPPPLPITYPEEEIDLEMEAELEDRDLELEDRDLELEDRDLELDDRDLELEDGDLELEDRDLELEDRDLELEAEGMTDVVSIKWRRSRSRTTCYL